MTRVTDGDRLEARKFLDRMAIEWNEQDGDLEALAEFRAAAAAAERAACDARWRAWLDKDPITRAMRRDPAPDREPEAGR